MFRNILVHVDDASCAAARIDLALSLASAHGARLTGLYVVAPSHPDGTSEEGDSTWTAQSAARAEELFRQRIDGAPVAGRWRCVAGSVAEVVARMARRSDLSVIGQGSSPGTDAEVSEAARIALAAGRPVLIVPAKGEFSVIGHQVLVAWSDSKEAARALNDALPILSSADRTVVLLVNPPEGDGAADGTTDIAVQLSSHGIKAVILRAFANRVGIGDAILNKARETGADMVVMGARGVLSTAQPALGQTTRHVLASMTVPVLMSG